MHRVSPHITCLTVVMSSVAAYGEVRFSKPAWSPDGRYLALSDGRSDGVHLYDTKTRTRLQITDSPSSGYAYHWSRDGRRLAFKLLIPAEPSVFPLQMPVVFDVDSRTLLPLHDPVARAGVPSFSDDGLTAFTIDQELRVVDASGRTVKVVSLGNYANLAPISPDGTKVAYNSRDDQIWVTELAAGTTSRLTADGHGYFNPVWSPDSTRLIVSTTSNRLKSIDILSGQIHELDEGAAPCWAPDGRTVFYCRTERIEGVRVEEADIYHIQWDGSGRNRLTLEDGEHETCARLSHDGRKIVFVSMLSGDLYEAPLLRADRRENQGGTSEYRLGPKVRIDADAAPLTTLDDSLMRVYPANGLAESTQTLSSSAVTLFRPVPYIHQVYDTPDSFNGHWACGASSALMGINYFGVLDHWDITCSWPYAHVSHYGQYVSEIYTYNGYTYDFRAKDASQHWAYGGYAYIVRDDWANTTGYMRDYINNHGLDSIVDWGPSWTRLQTEVNNDDPCVVLNALTSSGHYILAIGYYTDQHTGIFNDPYGDKNTPGYPSYDGAGVLYDWPGYNNGLANLNSVGCFIRCRGELPPLVTRHPESCEVGWGYDASFSVEAVGEGTLTYQWQKGTSDLTNGTHYLGVTTPILDVYDVTSEEAGEYRCVVSNAAGSTPSNSATLTVVGPPIAPGDMDRDGDVDQEDFGLFQACLTGPSVPQGDPACSEAKLDSDGDVDWYDFTVFKACVSGAGVPADPGCAD